MSSERRVEHISGVCPILYRQDNPDRVLVLRELTAKKVTGKLAGQYGPGFETVEDGETMEDTIERFFKEELTVVRGHVFIPHNLTQSEVCVARISPPHMQAWVHAFPCPVSDDFKAGISTFGYEVGDSYWISVSKYLNSISGPYGVIMRRGSREILRNYTSFVKRGWVELGLEYPDPESPIPWEVFDLLDQGLSQEEALSRLAPDLSKPLLKSEVLARWLSKR